jgi:hypothetical protein
MRIFHRLNFFITFIAELCLALVVDHLLRLPIPVANFYLCHWESEGCLNKLVLDVLDVEVLAAGFSKVKEALEQEN